MPKRYPGNLISPTPQIPANNYGDTPASGVWGMYEVADLIKRGLWPSLANINPGKFIENIFSTYVYDGTGSAQTITNGIDLSGEGGLVWVKNRDTAYAPMLFDTERGLPSLLYSSATGAADTTSGLATGTVTSFNSNGFSLGSEPSANGNNQSIASWTFRKAPKFFDVVTYTGDGTAGRQIAHNLGTTVGSIFIKCTSNARNWRVWHKDIGTTVSLVLNSSAAVGATNIVNSTAPTDSVFTVSDDPDVNYSGYTYVAYLFAHNNGDADFGPTGDQDIIKCGSYTGGGATSVSVDLGFEPQWVMIKAAAGTTGDWAMFDNIRGIPTGGKDILLRANTTAAEYSNVDYIDLTPTGFKTIAINNYTNGSGSTYIYIAVRRGPMAVPESATDVFDVDAYSGVGGDILLSKGFPVDAYLQKTRNTSGQESILSSRLTGWVGKNGVALTQLNTASTSAQAKYTEDGLDNNVGVNFFSGGGASNLSGRTYVNYAWKRAPNFFDVVTYTGDGTAGRTVSHNLGVAPEMMWVKSRTQGSENWGVYHSALGNAKSIRLDTTNPAGNDIYSWNQTSPTATEFTLGNYSRVNNSGSSYVAYLFATLAGISKVGSYNGNSGTQTIDCGFSAGARFVFVKAHSTTGAWFMWDSSRGIVAGNDPYLELNSMLAEEPGYDAIDYAASGFTLNNVGAGTNDSGTSYIFYAIA